MYIFNKLTLEIMLVDFYDKKLLPRGERKKKKEGKTENRSFEDLQFCQDFSEPSDDLLIRNERVF